jgi:hypothetical protein
MTGIFYGSFPDQEKQKKPLRSLRLCLPSEIHDSEERSGFNRGGSNPPLLNSIIWLKGSDARRARTSPKT